MKKKILCMGLAALMSLALVGCGSKSTETSSTSATSAAQATQAPAQTADNSTGTDASTGSDSSSDASGADSSSDSTFSLKDLEGTLTHGYMGTSEDDENAVLFLATNDDLTASVLIIANSESKENVSFVGESQANGDGTMSINDESSGTVITFGIEDNNDGTYTLDYGDIGKAVVAECEVSKVLEMMDTVDQNTTGLN